MKDGPAWTDWIAFIYGIFASVCILMLTSVAFVHRKKSEAVRAKNVPLLVLAGAGGLVHIWSAVVANGHLLPLSRAEHECCVLWNYWLPYAVGLSTWFVAVLLRLITYFAALSGRLSDHWTRRIQRYQWALAPLVVVVPIALACGVFASTGASRFDEQRDRCRSTPAFKAIVFAWIAACTAGLVTFCAYVRSTLREDYFNEFKRLRDIVAVGTIVALSNAAIVFSEALDFPAARLIATMNVATLHAFSVTRIGGEAVMRAAFGGRKYADRFVERQRDVAVPLRSAAEASEAVDREVGPDFESDFLDYCAARPEPISLKNRVSGTGSVFPEDLVVSYRRVRDWKMGFDSCTVEDLREEQMRIADQFLLASARRPLVPPRSAVATALAQEPSANMFDDVSKWIMRTLSKRFFDEYRSANVQEEGSSATVRDALERAERAKAARRIADARLADGYASATNGWFEGEK